MSIHKHRANLWAYVGWSGHRKDASGSLDATHRCLHRRRPLSLFHCSRRKDRAQRMAADHGPSNVPLGLSRQPFIHFGSGTALPAMCLQCMLKPGLSITTIPEAGYIYNDAHVQRCARARQVACPKKASLSWHCHSHETERSIISCWKTEA